MSSLIFILLLSITFIHAKPLRFHVSTWPSSAEISLNKAHAPYHPPQLSPYIFELDSAEKTVDVYILKQGYTAKKIPVQLKNSQDNYIQVFLSPELDSTIILQQNSYFRKRNLISLGKKLQWSALAPLVLAGFTAGYAQYSYSQAQGINEKLKRAQINSDSEFTQDQQDAIKYNQSGDQFKSIATWSSLSAVFIGSIGFALSF